MDENFSNKLITPSLIPNFINNKNYVNNTYNFIKKPIQPDFTLGSKNLVGHKNTSNINYMNKYNNIISRHNINNLPINKLYGHGKIMSQNNTHKYAYNFTNNKIYSDIYTREINNTFNYIKNQNKIKYGATNIQNNINGQNNNILNNRTATLNTNSMQNGNIVVNRNSVQNGNSIVNTNSMQNGNIVVNRNSVQNGTSTINGNNVQNGNSAQNGNSVQNGNNAQNGNSTINGNNVQNGNSGLGEVTDLGEGVLVGTQFSMEIDITDMNYLNRWTCGTGANVVNRNINLPNEFDCRVKWGKRIMGPLDQGTCGSCWAFACTTAFSDRVRIFSTLGTHTITLSNDSTRDNEYCLQNEENITLQTNIPLLVEEIKYDMTPTDIYIGPNFLSPYYLASCETCDLAYRLGKEIGDFLVENRICGNCCAGNTLQIAHIFLVIGGVITMGNNPSGYTECQNGNIIKCDPNNDPKGLCTCYGPQFFTGINDYAERDSGGSEVVKNDIINEFYKLYGTGEDNPNACFIATTFPLWKAQKVYRVNIYRNTELVNISELSQNTREIQLEIITNGPVTAAMLFYSNFATISQDVVLDENDATGDSGGHSVVIMGWGVGRTLRGDIKDYWLIRNSYGTGVQNGGYFKIERGVNFCRIEDDVWAAQPFQVYNPSLLYNDIDDIDTSSIITYIPPLCRQIIPDSYTESEKERFAQISANFYNTNVPNVSRQVTNPNA